MSDKKLTILGIVAVLTVIWAAAQSHISNRPSTAMEGPSYLIQGLDPADIDSIVLGSKEGTVTLKRQQGNFAVVEKDNYSAKASEINNLITKSLEIQTSQFVTDNPANHKDLGVTEEEANASIKFFKADSSLLTGIIAGKSKELGEGTYVRPASSNAVYVAATMPWIADTAMNYIEQELISVKRDDIVSVTVSSPEEQYTLKSTEDGKDVVLENIPAGKIFKDSDGDSVFTALTSLRCDDVMRNPGDLKFEREYVCRLKDSTIYALKTAQKDDKTYITCEADYTDKTPVTKDSTVESEEELKKKEAKLLAQEGAITFTAKHKGWVYEIAEWKAKNLTKKLSELLEEEKPPKEEKDNQATTGPTVEELNATNPK
ncbi:MAG: DUF4340 domain-containing protein [Sedimentisphaerales bacterium]|nr:DUF4340 domain-containing protein [Sedimentisphaerales bacterium]